MIEIIDNRRLYNAYLAGALEVIKNKNILNKINVFPVADGDTGTNLSSTMRSIIMEADYRESFKASFETIANAAIMGARGNSGIIFAEYLNGINQELTSSLHITLEDFIQANSKAVEYAYNAVAEPVEGTMITVIKSFALSLERFQTRLTNL